jgi:cytochrome c5
MMKKLAHILAPASILALVMTSTGCYYDKEELLYPGTSCDTTTATYSLKVKPIIDANCNVCHSAANAPNNGSNIVLDNYQGLKNYALPPKQRLMGSIQQLSGFSAMPKGQGRLSDCDISKIQAWINAGTPQ